MKDLALEILVGIVVLSGCVTCATLYVTVLRVPGTVIQIAQQQCAANGGLQRLDVSARWAGYEFHCANGMRSGPVTVTLDADNRH